MPERIGHKGQIGRRVDLWQHQSVQVGRLRYLLKVCERVWGIYGVYSDGELSNAGAAGLAKELAELCASWGFLSGGDRVFEIVGDVVDVESLRLLQKLR